MLQRSETIKQIQEALNHSCPALEHIQTNFEQLQELCEHSVKENSNLQLKSHLADLSLTYLDYLKQKLGCQEADLDSEQLRQLQTLSCQLSDVAVQNRDQLLSFGDNKQSNSAFDSESRCCQLLDLLIAAELVIFNLRVHDACLLH